LTNPEASGIIKTDKRKGNKTMKNYFDTINWTYLETCAEAGISVDCYISEDRKWMKQIWNDGYVEIHEIGD
jgi:hypothetical protein